MRAAFLLGLLSTASQVILLREAIARVPDQGIAVTLTLAAWLLAGAAGACLRCQIFTFDINVKCKDLTPVQFLFNHYVKCKDLTPLPLLLPLLVATVAAPYLLDALSARFRARPLMPLPAEGVGLSLLVVALPPFLAGRAFARLAEREPARVYAAESAGALAGGLLVTFGAAGRVGLAGQLLLLAAVVCAGMALPAAGARRKGRPALAALLCLLLLPLSPRLDRFAAERTHPGYRVTHVGESRQGRTLLLEREGGATLLVNGALVAARPPSATTVESGLLLARMHGSTETALLAAPAAARFADGILAATGRKPLLLLGDPALGPARAAAGVPARFLAEPFETHAETTAARYDLIVLPGGGAESLAEGRFATGEALDRAKRLLKPGGLVAVAAGEAGPYLPGYLAACHGAVRAALRERFAGVAVAAQPEVLWLGTDRCGRLRVDPREGGDGLTAAKLLYRFDPGRVAALTAAGEGAGPASAKRPAALAAGVARMAAQLTGRDVSGDLGRVAAALPTLLLLFPLVLFPYFRLAAGPAGLALALALFGGVAAMGTELSLLHLFQSARGDAYGSVGLLVGLFMAGLALGARMPPRGRGRAATALAAGALPPAALLLPAGAFDLPLAGALMALSGAATGALLPALLPFARAGRLYAADLAGAALGAAGAGLVALPLAGVDATATALAFGCATGAAMTFTLKPRG